MNPLKSQYFRCPYCGTSGGHEQKVSKKTGLFRIKILYNNVFIMQCWKCLRICRKLTVGATLLGKDMSPWEKQVFKDDKLQYSLNRRVDRHYEKSKSKLQEVKNEESL